jgi:hypothetical protein
MTKGSEMSQNNPSHIYPLSSDFESGLRLLAILAEVSPKAIDLTGLHILDYLTIYAADYYENLPSIHPPIPGRSVRILEKREQIKRGVELFESRKLIVRDFSAKGFLFSISEMGFNFLVNIKSDYIRLIRISAKAVVGELGERSFDLVRQDMYTRLLEWGAEYSQRLNDSTLLSLKIDTL